MSNNYTNSNSDAPINANWSPTPSIDPTLKVETAESKPQNNNPLELPIHPERLVKLGLTLGSLMMALALMWVAVIRGEVAFDVWFNNQIIWQDIVVGLGYGVFFSLLVWVASNLLSSFNDIRSRIVETVDMSQLTLQQIIVLSLVSAVPEEILFRGAIQPEAGLFLTALIFGALHSITPMYFIYAAVAGLGLGYLADVQGTLWMPIAAHFAVNTTSFILIRRKALQSKDEE